MGEDNKKLKELHIIDGATGEEIPVTPIKELELSEKEGEFEENLDEWFLARDENVTLDIDLDKKSFLKALKMFRKIEKEFAKNPVKDSVKRIKSQAGILPLTKKRARKLLMSHGYDRNSANSIISRMKNRNLKNLWEYFYL